MNVTKSYQKLVEGASGLASFCHVSGSVVEGARDLPAAAEPWLHHV